MRFRPLSLLVIGLAAPAAGQWLPVVRNLQVRPKETKFSSRIDTMKAFTRALGVRCTYCHVGKEGEPLETYDFASDDKEAKVKARAMLKMVAGINDQFLAALPSRHVPAVSVSCATCHRGAVVPAVDSAKKAGG